MMSSTAWFITSMAAANVANVTQVAELLHGEENADLQALDTPVSRGVMSTKILRLSGKSQRAL